MLSENRFVKAAKDEAIAVIGGFVHINDANGSFGPQISSACSLRQKKLCL